jgi:sugar lactone lactonase YvrE
MADQLNLLVEGIAFGEAPRWHAGALYLSDIHADRVLRVEENGTIQVVAQFQGPVSGLGWLPDGSMLVVSMHDRLVLRQAADGTFHRHADLGGIATWHANDMIVAPDGTAYVGNFGFDLEAVPIALRTASIARITPSGEVSVAAEDLWFPNGMVITPDGSTLIVAESAARVLTAFSIAIDGGLTDRRLWAGLPDGALPDGICLDADGFVWVASPASREVLRIGEGGAIAERITTEQEAIACVLGGEDRRTLFITTADSRDPGQCRTSHSARVMTMRVAVPGAGTP